MSDDTERPDKPKKSTKRRKLEMLLGMDLVLATVLSAVVWFLLPPDVDAGFAKDLYALGTSVLAIIFAVYIPALAIIMSADDETYVEFLAEDDTFEVILFGFKCVLVVLFAALLCSLALFGGTAAWQELRATTQSRWWLVTYTFVVVWSITGTYQATAASIQHSVLKMRVLSHIQRRGQSGTRQSARGTEEPSRQEGE